jgi:hypothetical protein
VWSQLNLTTGKDGMILDLVVETGNPADKERFMPMLERHIGTWGQASLQAAAMAALPAATTLIKAKAGGVCDMAFHKKAGLRIEDVVGSNQAYRKLRNLRSRHLMPKARLRSLWGLSRRKECRPGYGPPAGRPVGLLAHLRSVPFPDKVIRSLLRTRWPKRRYPVYETGTNVRDWLFVEDHARALAMVVTLQCRGRAICVSIRRRPAESGGGRLA